MKRSLTLAVILLTSLAAMAEQKTVNIVTVNNPDMIPLKKLSTKFEEIEAWRVDYNTRRPHSALVNLPAAAFASRAMGREGKQQPKMEPLPAGN